MTGAAKNIGMMRGRAENREIAVNKMTVWRRAPSRLHHRPVAYRKSSFTRRRAGAQ